MKIVVDTNVVLSGIFFQGPPNQILEDIMGGLFKIVLSKEIINEYTRVMIRYGKKKKVLDLTEPLEIIDLLIADSLFIDSVDILTPYCDDPDDIKFLQAAIAARAKYLISGDKHLLKVAKYQYGVVLKPKEFIDAVYKQT